MLRGFDSRTQLERLHDRHKRFSFDVYDIHGKDEDEKLTKNQKKTKDTDKLI